MHKSNKIKEILNSIFVLNDQTIYSILKYYSDCIPWQFGKSDDMDIDTAKYVLKMIIESEFLSNI